MKNKLILQLFLLTLTATSIQVDSSLHCDCAELNQDECNQSTYWCVWNVTTSECQSYSFKCSNQTTEITCLIQSDLCAWNNGACIDYDKVCSDFTDESKCKNGNNCYWNIEKVCENFSVCSNYSVDNCPTQEWCSKLSGTCTDYKFVVCSEFMSQSTCIGFESKSSYCAWDNDGKCSTLEEISDCSQLNNFKQLCSENNCVYEDNACRAPKCSDKQESTCSAVRTTGTTYTLCSYKDGQCQDATDTSNLTKDTCFSRTRRNYKWSSDNKCVECDTLIDGSFDFQIVFGSLLFIFIGL
ncbi:unnamed protein product [Paramecium primaurelia]|uniref:PSI domain-containing protein n=1 Tax=Paramecium primaurelia TaxID=5886 RepID=A0A8S1LCY6_PARPR|nr:unnamed protein product [Paramecium primaurelia]